MVVSQDRSAPTLPKPQCRGGFSRSALLWVGLAGLLVFSPALASKMRPLPTETLIAKAETALAANDFRTGIALYERAVRSAPETPGLYLDLALACERGMFALGEAAPQLRATLFHRMLDAYREARDRFPEDDYIAASYAATCSMTEHLDFPVDIAEAISAWEYCLRLRELAYAERPTQFNEQEMILPLLSLGRLNIQSGAFDEARGYLDRVGRIAPESAVVAKLRARLANAESHLAAVRPRGE